MYLGSIVSPYGGSDAEKNSGLMAGIGDRDIAVLVVRFPRCLTLIYN